MSVCLEQSDSALAFYLLPRGREIPPAKSRAVFQSLESPDLDHIVLPSTQVLFESRNQPRRGEGRGGLKVRSRSGLGEGEGGRWFRGRTMMGK